MDCNGDFEDVIAYDGGVKIVSWRLNELNTVIIFGLAFPPEKTALFCEWTCYFLWIICEASHASGILAQTLSLE